MLVPRHVSAYICRATSNPIPSGEGSFARFMVFVVLLLAAVSGFAQTIPHITASFGNTGGSRKIVLNFTSEVNGLANSIAVIDGTISYTYRGNSSVSSSRSLELLLSDFKNETNTSVSIENSKSYVLRIPAGTFKDEYENGTQEYVFSFNGNGSYYEASLNESSFTLNKPYDNDKEALSWDFELTNLSSYNIAVESLYLEENAECSASLTCNGAQNFTLTPLNFTVNNPNIAKDAKAIFNVSLNNANAGTYKANLVVKPSNGIQTFNVPIAIIIGKRQITADLSLKSKEYDGNVAIEFIVTPNNEAPGDEDKVKLAGSGIAYFWRWHPVGSYGYYGWDPDPNVGEKCAGDIEVRWDWPDGVYDMEVINNYELPPKLVGVPSSTVGNIRVCFTRITIMPAEWSEDVPEIAANPSSFTYDKNFSLNKIELSGNEQGSWKFRNFAEIVNPHDFEEDSVAIWYAVEFAPPEDSVNYRSKQGEVLLTIRKRSFNNNLKYAAMDAPCGESSGNLIIEAEDSVATVVYEGIENRHLLRFPVTLKYGANIFKYSILSEAYEEDNPNYSNDLSYYFERSMPFRKVAYWIRGKTLTLDLDTSDPLDEAFFSRYDFDYAKTEWYKGKELVYVGRNYSVLSSGGGDYSVMLTGRDKETGIEVRFATCKESGAPPEVTPLTQPPTGGSIKLIASSFGSRMVPGGTNLMLNTPEGGKVSVYTVAGELITMMNAVDARTIVKLPNTHKMYIVKLEAQ